MTDPCLVLRITILEFYIRNILQPKFSFFFHLPPSPSLSFAKESGNSSACVLLVQPPFPKHRASILYLGCIPNRIVYCYYIFHFTKSTRILDMRSRHLCCRPQTLRRISVHPQSCNNYGSAEYLLLVHGLWLAEVSRSVTES